MKSHGAVLALVALAALAGCAEQQEIKEIAIPGHARVYQFSYDVREALAVPANSVEGIVAVLATSDTIHFAFNSTSKEDNARFRVVIFNIVSKLTPFFAEQGGTLHYNVFYYDAAGQWYNATDDKIPIPQVSEPTIWFIGPDTQANETSLLLDRRAGRKIVYLQGTGSKQLVLAGDRLVLIVMGIDEKNVHEYAYKG